MIKAMISARDMKTLVKSLDSFEGVMVTKEPTMELSAKLVCVRHQPKVGFISFAFLRRQ